MSYPNPVMETGRMMTRVQKWLFTAFACVGLVAAGDCVRDAAAACQSGSQMFKDTNAAVPCSDTTTCFLTGDYDINISCSTRATVVAWKNTNPPAGWCNCGPASGTTLTCSETLTSCGTTVWFWHPQCLSGYTCTPDPAVNIAYCKC